jgi:putative transcriptional regulator
MKTKQKKTTRTNKAGRELVAALQQLYDAVKSGDTSKLRVDTVEVPDPADYGPREVRALRDSLGVSQGIFAALVGVSPAQVAHWEHGIRKPSPLACRLFDTIKKNPTDYAASLIRRRSA